MDSAAEPDDETLSGISLHSSLNDYGETESRNLEEDKKTVSEARPPTSTAEISRGIMMQAKGVEDLVKVVKG